MCMFAHGSYCALSYRHAYPFMIVFLSHLILTYAQICASRLRKLLTSRARKGVLPDSLVHLGESGDRETTSILGICRSNTGLGNMEARRQTNWCARTPTLLRKTFFLKIKVCLHGLQDPFLESSLNFQSRISQATVYGAKQHQFRRRRNSSPYRSVSATLYCAVAR